MTPNRHPHILIVAGEASGDMHAAHVVAELQRLSPGMTFAGLGGPRLAEQGVELYADLTQMAVIGFTDVLRHYRAFRQAFYLVLARAAERRPDAVILVDYPGFNLRLAKAFKKRGIPVIYYISPQVWAWKENRVRLIRKVVDRMLVVFAFEKDFYAKHGMTVDFVGHPLVDTVKTLLPPDEVLDRLGLKGRRPVVALLPGSRDKEIERILPVMLQAAERLKKNLPHVHFLLIQAPTVSAGWLDTHLRQYNLPLTVIGHDTMDAVRACDAVMVASGTATLEAALLERPMVIVYRTSWITWLMARLLIRIPMIGLVNIVAREKIVPELIQNDANPARLAQEISALISDEKKQDNLRLWWPKIRALLGESGAAARAARVILDVLAQKETPR